MQGRKFAAMCRRFLRSEAGSLRISAALFITALLCAGTIAGLGVAGLMQVPRLIYLVFAVVVVAAAWDAWREWRKSGRD